MDEEPRGTLAIGLARTLADIPGLLAPGGGFVLVMELTGGATLGPSPDHESCSSPGLTASGAVSARSADVLRAPPQGAPQSLPASAPAGGSSALSFHGPYVDPLQPR